MNIFILTLAELEAYFAGHKEQSNNILFEDGSVSAANMEPRPHCARHRVPILESVLGRCVG